MAMFLINVIPITRGILKENLSYFSSEDIPIGSLVEVPLRNKKISALVVDKKNAAEAKAEIKKADFSIKKISEIKYSKFLPQEFIETAK
ncbi:MAG: Uncharacterized protein G01um1014107_71 [Parcubacteria group bacterium Gr01-1014_107]|nr:MAG: Uncharacterized protein G01um1014107_71 [Parcubacteria group bacterium Gr01-1014_107]